MTETHALWAILALLMIAALVIVTTVFSIYRANRRLEQENRLQRETFDHKIEDFIDYQLEEKESL